MPVKLFLIRHGETAWNLAKKYCGHIDVGLNEKGKLQAKRLCARINKELIHRVYSSDRLRAVQTAKIAFKNKKINISCRLREIHFGLFEGLTHEEILKKYPEFYKKWLTDPYSVDIPGGESLKKFEKRVVRAIEDIALNNPGKNIALVCHGGAISVFLSTIFKKGGFWEYVPSSASVSVVEFSNKKAKALIINDVSHLE